MGRRLHLVPSSCGATGCSVPLHVTLSTRHRAGLAAIGGREPRSAAGLPGKEFPATAHPIPKDGISRNYPLPAHCRLPLLFQVSLWHGAMRAETRAERIHGNAGGWRSALARFTVHASSLHQVPLIKDAEPLPLRYLPCEHRVSSATRGSETALAANKNKR